MRALLAHVINEIDFTCHLSNVHATFVDSGVNLERNLKKVSLVKLLNEYLSLLCFKTGKRLLFQYMTRKF